MRISKVEIILVLLGFITVGIFLAVFAGGPIYSDELSLMNAGLNNLKDPFHLNRYTHIFLQKPFLELSSTPLEGAKIYWAFVLTLTGFLTFWCARLLTPESHLIHALLASMLFFSFHFFIDYSGVTIVDFTAMLMVMVFITTYILAARFGLTRAWLVALGFIFFLAFKSKETTLVVSVLLLGFGFQDGREFRIKTLWKNLINFGIGLLAGVLFFVVLNAVLLREPFFGLSPASIKDFLDTYANLPRLSIPPNTPGWYSGVLAVVWVLPFILYLMSGFKQSAGFSNPIRLLWVVPALLVIFLTLMTLVRSYKIDQRFFFPALPVMCILGAQLVPFDAPANHSTKIRFWLYLFLVALACVGVNYLIRPLAGYMDQTFEDFLTLIFYPLLVSILIISAFFIKRYNPLTILIPVACILSMVITPIRTNIKYLAVLHQNVARVEYRFSPFSTFASQLDSGSSQQFFVSSNVHDELDMLSADANEVNAMYNIYFDRHLTRQNFTVSASPSSIWQEFQGGNFDNALLTLSDWQELASGPPGSSFLQTNYNIFNSSSIPVILLVKK